MFVFDLLKLSNYVVEEFLNNLPLGKNLVENPV